MGVFMPADDRHDQEQRSSEDWSLIPQDTDPLWGGASITIKSKMICFWHKIKVDANNKLYLINYLTY